MDLLLATHNLGKIREYRALLKGFANFDIYSLVDYPAYHAPDESGDTFAENAQIKALAAAKYFPDKIVIADDSGLVVPALQNEPGVLSARYAGVSARDIDNRKKLIQRLKTLSEEDRLGHFECAICMAKGDQILKKTAGICEGFLLIQEKGNNGFGYDSLFVKHGYNKTFAELGASVKNEVSHRRKALQKVAAFLEDTRFIA